MNALAGHGGPPARPRRARVPDPRPRRWASTWGRRSGFTLIELIVVVAVVGIIAVMLLPNLIQLIHRSRFEGFMRQAQSVVNLAKLEAIRRGTPVVVWIDETATPSQITVFADVHGATMTTAPDPASDNPAYLPQAGQPRGTTDYIVGGPMSIPADISLTGPAGPGQAYDGLTSMTPVAGAVNVPAIVFQSDGSVLDPGAFRFADTHGNFLELWIAPQATARITLRMWNADLPDWPTGSGEHWYEFGEGGEHWSWK